MWKEGRGRTGRTRHRINKWTPPSCSATSKTPIDLNIRQKMWPEKNEGAKECSFKEEKERFEAKWRSGPGTRRQSRRNTFRFGREYRPTRSRDSPRAGCSLTNILLPLLPAQSNIVEFSFHTFTCTVSTYQYVNFQKKQELVDICDGCSSEVLDDAPAVPDVAEFQFWCHLGHKP